MQPSRAGALAWVVAISLLLPAQHAWAKHDSVPDWVHAAAAETLPKYHKEPKAVILLDDTEYTVRPDGRLLLHERIVRKILRPQGRSEAEFDNLYTKDSKLNWMHVWSIGPDGKEYAVKDNEQIDAATTSYGLYDDEHVRAGRAPAGDPGAVVAMEYEQLLPKYEQEALWSLQDNLPLHRNRLTLHLPPGFTYSAKWSRHDAVAPKDLGNNSWQWEVMDSTHHDMEDVPLAPSPGELEQMLTLHYAAPGAVVKDGWQDIGEWYTGLTAGRTDTTPEMANKAKELTAGMTDLYQKAQAIDDFVRGHIRYVAIEIGIGGYQPHNASDIFSNRYGDCKDKATLLVAMLGAVGVRSTWVLVDTEHHIDAAMPSLIGNHMIAAVELPPGYDAPGLHSVVTTASGKRYLLTDPTWDFTPFGQIEDDLQGTAAMLMDGSSSQAIQIPVMDPALNTWKRTGHFKLAADGSLTGQVEERLYGDVAADMRYRFSLKDQHERDEALEFHVNADLTGFTLSDVKLSNLEDVDKEIVLTYSVSAASYAKTMGSLMMFRPRVLGTDTLPVEDKERRYPVNFEQSTLRQDSFDIQMPPGYAVDELTHPVEWKADFASYESHASVQGDTLHYERTYTNRVLELPPFRYNDVIAMESTIGGDEQKSVVLSRSK